MAKRSKPRAGSLQFWPRKRAKKLLPRVNWLALEKKYDFVGFLGGIGYKAGMARYLVRDLTPNSMTKGKETIIPVTFIECPPMKIASIRFYKDSRVSKEILTLSSRELKYLKRKMRLPKEPESKEKILEKLSSIEISDYDDLRAIVYSLSWITGLKKTPDLAEIGLGGDLKEKFNFVKENIDKEITLENLFEKITVVDVRGVTKGKGFAGPVKRFGIGLKAYKSEKGRRRPGSIGPWTPSKVTFRAPLAGQLGMFTRIVYNSKIISFGQAKMIELEFPHYGKIKTSFVALKGSVQGPPKRQLLLTAPLRKTKKIEKQQYELIKLLK